MKGFTLIELLVAIVVISIGLVGVVSFYPVFGKGSVKTEQKTLAVNLCRQRIEEIKAISFIAISTGNPSALSDTVMLQGKPTTRRVDVFYVDTNNTEVGTATNLKKIRVSIAGVKSVTLKANY
ncbi:MAG: type II secretion system protein [Elusimicrobiota bacterium]